MRYDMGIIYHAKLKEVRETIEKLNKLSLDMTSVTKSVDTIEKEMEKKVQNSYSSFGNGPTAFLYDSLTTDYTKAIKELDTINENLKREWETYYKIDKKKKEIENDIQNANEENIKDIISRMKSLLEDLRKTSTIDFNLEKQLVLDIYELAYKTMKLELIFTNETTFLDYIKGDPVNSQYIVDQMKKEIKQIESEEQEEITSKILELEKEGMENNLLLNKNLLMLLALFGNEDLARKKKADFLRKTSHVESIGYDIKENLRIEEKRKGRIEAIDIRQKENFRKGLAKRIVLILNALIITLSITAGSIVSRNITKGREYKTITTVYDTSTDEETTEESYKRGKNESVKIVEYSPWDEPGYFREKYKRNVYNYELYNVEKKENPQDYLTENIKDNVRYNSQEETTKEIPDDLGYTENKYVVKTVKKDLEDYKVVDTPITWGLLTFLIAAGVITADVLTLKKLSKESLKVIRERSKANKKEKQTEEEYIEKSHQELIRLLEEQEVSLNEVLQEFYNLPTAIQELEEVKEAKQKVLAHFKK